MIVGYCKYFKLQNLIKKYTFILTNKLLFDTFALVVCLLQFIQLIFIKIFHIFIIITKINQFKDNFPLVINTDKY